MLRAIIPYPGTAHGPCAQPCRHVECGDMRATAHKECPYCGGFLGYDVHLTATSVGWDSDGGNRRASERIAHSSCLDQADEARRAGRTIAETYQPSSTTQRLLWGGERPLEVGSSYAMRLTELPPSE